MKKWITLIVLGFFALGCAPEESQPTPMPMLVFGPTPTATADVPTPAPLLSKTIQLTYAYALVSASTSELVVVAEFDLPGSDDVLLPSNLDLEALKLVSGNSPVFNLLIEIQEGTSTRSGFTDVVGRFSVTLSPSGGYTAYIPGWNCTETYNWELPDVNGNVQSRGGTLSCKKN